MLKWRIYYGDGTTFSSEDGEPVDAPGYGVQCIVQPEKNRGRSVMQGWDWYYYNADGRWWGCNENALLLRHVFRKSSVAPSAGETISEEEFFAITTKAGSDPDFLPRSSIKPTRCEQPIGTNE
jgi:hypothetical protein